MNSNIELIEYLSGFLTSERLAIFKKVLYDRTRYATVVLEDIFQSQNASAVLRSCDCFGIQDVHVIENRNSFEVNPQVSMGSSKWLNIHQYNSKTQNTVDALKSLKKQGYRIVATSPHQNDVELQNFDFKKGKFAFVFGTELNGISEQVIENADEFLKIPMFGFTESFNISVSVAIILHQVSQKLRSEEINFRLTEDESNELMLQWLMSNIRESECIVSDFLNKSKI